MSIKSLMLTQLIDNIAGGAIRVIVDAKQSLVVDYFLDPAYDISISQCSGSQYNALLDL